MHTSRHRTNNAAVLVLNAAYEPITIANAKSAMKLLIKGKAVMELESDRRMHRDFLMPSVVRLSDYFHIPLQQVLPRRDNVFLRDGHTCQYCYNVFSTKDLTLDHVVPRVQGGLSTWSNLVACCKPCNSFKAGRTPEQAGMELLRKPRQMTIHTSRAMLRMIGSGDPTWRKYLYH